MSNLGDDRVLRIGELRKMISEMRKEYTPPLGRMKRAELLAHYRQLSGLKPEKPTVKPTGAAPLKKTAPKIRVVEEVEEDEEEEEEQYVPPPKAKKTPAPKPKAAPKPVARKKPIEQEEQEQEEQPRQRDIIPGRAPFVPRAQREDSAVSSFGMRAPSRGRKNSMYDVEE
jgi:hypothetical protein